MRCRQVCTLWKREGDRIKVEELIAYDATTEKAANERLHWFHWNKFFKYENATGLSCLLSSNFSFQLDVNLKRLHLNNRHSTLVANRFTRFLVKLKLLQHLELLLGEPYLELGPLLLPELEILKLEVHGIFGEDVVLTSAKLRRVCCDNMRFLVLTHPETVTHLTTDSYGSQMHALKNLEYLQCNRFHSIPQDLLLSHPSLRELNANDIDCLRSEEYTRESRDTLLYIMKQKLTQRRADFQLYVQGVLITDRKQLETFDFDLKNTRLQMQAYQSLATDLSFCHYVNYSDLLDSVDQIPADYFRRFFNIQQVAVRKPVNQPHFTWFLRNLNDVRSLDLVDASLSQSFYDRLPDLCSDLTDLRVHENPDISLNLDSILKLRNLQKFAACLKLETPYDLITESFKTLNELLEFNFKIGTDELAVWKAYPEVPIGFTKPGIKYKVASFLKRERFINYLQFTELINHCNDLKHIDMITD